MEDEELVRWVRGSVASLCMEVHRALGQAVDMEVDCGVELYCCNVLMTMHDVEAEIRKLRERLDEEIGDRIVSGFPGLDMR